MMLEENKRIVRRWVEEMCGQQQLMVADEIFAPDLIDHNPVPDQQPGPAGQKQVLTELWAGFPDFHTDVDDIIAEGDRVVLRWTARGTHQGEYAGIPPTGRSIVYTGIDIVRLAGGQIVERWGLSDDAGLLQQLETDEETD
jgi:steroid delta-isomerase-like uncharacterized protein